MTKPVSRKMAVDCLLYWFQQPEATITAADGSLAIYLKCPECRKPILPGQVIQFDHRHADVHGGPHNYKAIRPVHYDPCHKKKTARDIKAKAKGDRILGLTKTRPKRKMPRRPFPKRGPAKLGSRPMRRRNV